MSKYDPLWRHIKETAPAFLNFDEVERVCGFPIDHSFLNAKKELEAYLCQGSGETRRADGRGVCGEDGD